MVSAARTSIVVVAAFIVGWLACGHIMAGRNALPIQPQVVVLRPGKGPSAGESPGPWKKPGTYCAPPGSKERVRLRRLFAGSGQAIRWAEEAFGGTRVIAHCQDPGWCVVLVDRGLPYNSWDALLFSYVRPYTGKFELRWISYGCVTVVDSGDWPDCAYIEEDGRTLVFQTRAGKKLSVTKLPSKLWP